MPCLSFTTMKRGGTECQGLRFESITRDVNAARKPVLVAYDSSIDTFRFSRRPPVPPRDRSYSSRRSQPPETRRRPPRPPDDEFRQIHTSGRSWRSLFRARRALRDPTELFSPGVTEISVWVLLRVSRFFDFRGISSIIVLDAKMK